MGLDLGYKRRLSGNDNDESEKRDRERIRSAMALRWLLNHLGEQMGLASYIKPSNRGKTANLRVDFLDLALVHVESR